MCGYAVVDRLTDTGLERGMALTLTMGDDPKSRLIAEAFMRQQHVMISQGTVCMIVPPYYNWREALERLKELNAQKHEGP